MCYRGNTKFYLLIRRKEEDNIEIYTVKCDAQTGVNEMEFVNAVNSFRFLSIHMKLMDYQIIVIV
jgi:hypothetical protein